MSSIDKGEDERGFYRPIYVSLWEDRDFQRLDPNVKLVLLNLRTSPLSNMPCIYPIYYEAIQKHTGLSDEIIKNAIDALCKANWIEYEDGIVWVKKALKFNPVISLKKDTHLKSIQKALRSLPNNLGIVESFLEFYNISMGEPRKTESTDPPATHSKEEKEAVNRLVNLWNVICGGVLPKVMSVTDTRYKHINVRLAERPDFEVWTGIFKKISITPFLLGENNSGWKATFDWVINPNNLVKILEGNWPTTKEKTAKKPEPGVNAAGNLWGNCKKCGKESLKGNLNQNGLCFNCNPEAEKQTERLKELMKTVGKTIPGQPSTSSKPEPME